jgi:hypothetical protein
MKMKHRNNSNHLKPRLKKFAAAVLAVLNSYAYANSEKLVNPANSHAYQRLDSALDWRLLPVHALQNLTV